MRRAHQDVAKRLILLEKLLGLKAADICRKTKIAPNAWSQYTDTDGKRRITLDAAYKLKDAYGVTLEWIYDDDDSRLPQDIAAALRKVRKAA
jgi:transcriptional regulator with XRE-family HTH domain